MRILAISPRQCWPAESGAKLREYHLLRVLGGSAELTLVQFAEPGPQREKAGGLAFARAVESVDKPKTYAAGALLQGVVGRWPLPVLNYTSQAMMRRVVDLAQDKQADAIHLESIHMVRYALALRELLPGLRIFYNWHNIESELMERYRETAPSLAKRWYAGITAAKLRRLEVQVLHEADGHLVCSERERAKLAALVPEARIAVVENGVDCTYFAQAGGEMKSPPRMVFVGSMDYHPNVDGAVWFAREVWPAVRARIPGAELAIVGARPTEPVRALGAVQGVTVTGTVPDVRPYYRGALAAVVPLRTGGGTRLKILEAMAAGVPVVSTPLGAEGLEVTQGRHLTIVDTDEPLEWARALQELGKEPGPRKGLIEEGLKLVRERYDWQVLGGKLVALYEQLLEQRA